MGKFSRKSRRYTFVSTEEMISDIVVEYDDGNDITIIVNGDEVSNILVPLISMNKFSLQSIDWSIAEMDGYEKEYVISLYHLCDEGIFVERCWCNTNNSYYNLIGECDVTFCSNNISKNLYNEVCNNGENVILYNIED